MKEWLALAKRLDFINKVAAIIARWSVLIMLSLGLWNVIGRYLGSAIGHNLSSNGLIEGQWYLFDVVFLLGLGWTLQKQDHVRVDVMQGNWSKKRKAKVELFGTLLLLLPFTFGIIILSLEPALQSWIINEISPDPNGLPRYWIKTLIPFGFLILMLQGIAEAIKNWAHLRKSSLYQLSKKEGFMEKKFD